MDKLLKITTINGKILTLCERFLGKGSDVACFAKKENGWMKMDVFHG